MQTTVQRRNAEKQTGELITEPVLLVDVLLCEHTKINNNKHHLHPNQPTIEEFLTELRNLGHPNASIV